MKTVFSKTQDVANLWAAQSQPEARTGSNTRFRDDTLYSYGTPAVAGGNPPIPGGGLVALVSSTRFSKTTAVVIGECRHAATARGLPVFEVPEMGVEPKHVAANLAYLANRVAETLDKLQRGRASSVASYRSAAKAQIALANHYAETFGEEWRYAGPDPDDVKHASEVTA